VEEAGNAAEAIADVCGSGVDVALDRASHTKNKIEHQYLLVVEKQGEASREAQSLDAQVHFLRDEIEALQLLAEPCPKRMFDGPREESR